MVSVNNGLVDGEIRPNVGTPINSRLMVELPVLSAMIRDFEIQACGDYEMTVTYRVGSRFHEVVGEYTPEPVSVKRLPDGEGGLARYDIYRKDALTGRILWKFVYGRDRRDNGISLLPLFYGTEADGSPVGNFSLHPMFGTCNRKAYDLIVKRSYETEDVLYMEKFIAEDLGS